jgi:hypothetical protein
MQLLITVVKNCRALTFFTNVKLGISSRADEWSFVSVCHVHSMSIDIINT